MRITEENINDVSLEIAFHVLSLEGNLKTPIIELSDSIKEKIRDLSVLQIKMDSLEKSPRKTVKISEDTGRRYSW